MLIFYHLILLMPLFNILIILNTLTAMKNDKNA